MVEQAAPAERVLKDSLVQSADRAAHTLVRQRREKAATEQRVAMRVRAVEVLAGSRLEC
jgi:hypothetical protein